jgi:hypothetical protein
MVSVWWHLILAVGSPIANKKNDRHEGYGAIIVTAIDKTVHAMGLGFSPVWEVEMNQNVYNRHADTYWDRIHVIQIEH